MPTLIGTLNEKPLHAALKEWYAEAGDRFEERVGGYVVDIVRKNLLIEIQTGAFFPIRRKLDCLSKDHRVRLVYPIAEEKWIVKRAKGKRGKETRRKSPKRGAVEDVFHELVTCPKLLKRRKFSLEVVLIQEEEVRRYDGVRGWRKRGWVTEERRLLDIVERRLFKTPRAMASLIPADLPEPFRTADLAEATDRPLWLAQQMAYCLREMKAIIPVGKQANWILYQRSD